MDESYPQVSSTQEMTKLENTPSPDSTSIVTVTTAEVSSAETTESPRQQPRAVTMATETATVSYSTVHVQQSPSLSLLLTKSASEPLPHNPRKTLVRSAALRSTPSPPPPPADENSEAPILQPVNNTSFEYSYQPNDNSIPQESTPRQDSFGHMSKQGSFSRDNSFEYTDSTGTDLHEFIVKTLRNPRDRKFVLKLEHDFLNFIQDPLIIFIKYPPMTSYYRMIVHRVAAFFGMEHNVDQQTGKSVIINKSMNTRIPDQRFADLVSLSREESEDSEGSLPPRSILRRDNVPLGDSTPPKIDSPLLHSLGMDDKRQKSFEEREQEYNLVRERIFNQGSQSSQSSQSSKGDGDMPLPQILTREETEFMSQEQARETAPRILKSQSFDERTMDKRGASNSGIRIMSNKMFTRSSSSPGGSAAAFAASERLSKSTGSPKGSRVSLAGYSVPVSGMQYWTPEGVPLVPVPGSDVSMVQPQGIHAGMLGTVPVMGTAGGPQGNVMWPLPSESLQQGMMLINPSTGTPALGPDGNPIIVQPSYQPVVMKPGGNNPGFAHQQQQPRSQQIPQQQPTAQVGQSPTMAASQPGQMVMPYMGVQQPLYVVQQPGRPAYGQQQGSENLNQVQWSGNSHQMASASYQDLGNQFGAMSLTGQPQEMDQSLQQGMMGGDSGAVPSSTASSPMYVSSITQGSGQPGQVQYVILPAQQQMRSMVGQPVPSHIVPQGMQQGSNPQQNPAYVVAQQTPYSPSTFQPQYQRSQSPPTPPQTSSPVLASSYNQQSVAVNSPGGQNTQYQQQSTSHTQSPVLRPMVPLVVAGTHPVPVGATVVPGNQPGQIPSQGGSIPPYHVVPVQAQFHQSGQNRIYNLDRRQAKDLYTHETAAMVAGQPAMGPVAFGQYGDHITIIPSGDRGHYAQYFQPQRFSQPQSVSSVPHQQYSKHKSKQYHKKKDSPREQNLKKQTSKSSDTDTTTGGCGNVLEIYDIPSEMKDQEVDVLFQELKSAGAKIRWPNDSATSSRDTMRAVFSCAADADQALARINNPHFKLRISMDASVPVQSNT